MVHLGRMYADRGDYHKAIRVYSEAVTSRPTSYQPQVGPTVFSRSGYSVLVDNLSSKGLVI